MDVVRRMLEAGVKLVQYREKAFPMARMYEECRAIRKLCAEYRACFIVNNAVELALAVEADGVHVGQDDMPADLTRRLVGSDMLVGVSCRDVLEARQALAAGADYLGVGAIFATPTKADIGEATGVEVIAAIRREVGLPIVAIGGINATNAARVIAAGADGIAVVSAVYGQPDPRAACQMLKTIVRGGSAMPRDR